MNRYRRRDAHVQDELTIVARQPGGFVQEGTFPLCISGTVRTLYPAERHFHEKKIMAMGEEKSRTYFQPSVVPHMQQ
jgi:hypothetical protein